MPANTIFHGDFVYTSPNLQKEIKPFVRMLIPHVRKAVRLSQELLYEQEKFLLPENLFVFIRPIRRKNILGQYVRHALGVTGHIDIDPHTMNPRAVANTIAHELRHCFQYETKKLQNLPNKIKSWEGRRFVKYRNYQQYLNAPWEIDARKFAEIFSEKFGKEFPSYDEPR